MNKAELIAAVAKDMDSSRAEAERAVNCVLDNVQKGVKKDGNCQIVGFGTWTVRKRAARNGRNPQTGAPIKIKASKTVGYKPSANFKKMV